MIRPLNYSIFILLFSFSNESLAENKTIDENLSFLGTNKITVDFQLKGKTRKISFLKSCVKKDSNLPKNFPYSFGDADYISDEGWAIRLNARSGRLHADLSTCIEKGADDLVFNWYYNGPPIPPNARVAIDSGKSKFVDNVNDPTLVEFTEKRITAVVPARPKGPNVVNALRFYSSMYDQKQIDAINLIEKKDKKIFIIKKVTVQYHPPEKETTLGQIEKLKLFNGDLPNNSKLVSYHAYALSKEDWSKNIELKTILERINNPTILDPQEIPEIKPLYKTLYENNILLFFPRKDAAFGLQHRYLFKLIYPTLIDKKYWDVRQVSFQKDMYIAKKLVPRPELPPLPKGKKYKANNATYYMVSSTESAKYDEKLAEYRKTYFPTSIMYGVLSKIRMGDNILDLADYPHLLNIKHGHIWAYDPKTKLMIKFENHHFDLR